MRLRIPAGQKLGIAKIQELSSASADELIGVLRTAPLKFYRRELTAAVKERLPSIPAGDTAEIIDVIATMEFARATADAPLDDFMRDMEPALQREGLPTKNADGTSTVERLKLLLSVPSIGIPAKARTLLMEGRTLCKARVITDIRPVFDASDDPAGPEAALIVHNLRLSYHDDSSRDVRDFIVSFDPDDLDALLAILTRAKRKEQRLAAFLDAAKTPLLKIR